MTLEYERIEIHVKQNSALKTPFFSFIVHHSHSSPNPKLSIGSLIKENEMQRALEELRMLFLRDHLT